MLAANGHHWFDRRTPDSSWSSFAVSVLLTLALFAAAFVAMRTVPAFTPADRQKPVVVRLEPPVPRAQPKPIPKPTVAPPRAAPAVAPVEPPTTTSPLPAPIVSAPPTVPAGPERRDTTSVPTAAPTTVPTAIAAPRSGAPMAPSGVTSEQFWRGSAQFRDSSKTIHVGDLRPGVLTAPPTDQEKKDIAERQRRAAMVARRATTAGAANDVHIPTGTGTNGEGASSSGGGGSIPLPLFSRGPSAAQRKKDEAIDADNRATLKRLQDRIKQRRDSILADSIAKAKVRIVPG